MSSFNNFNPSIGRQAPPFSLLLKSRVALACPQRVW